MDMIPPSYETAIARSPWGIIATYIPSGDLCALSRVNHELNETFAPCLWGNPASHFGTENDRVYGQVKASRQLDAVTDRSQSL